MTAFVTGGSGFVGGAVIRALVAEGEKVRALARRAEATSAVADLGAEPVAGDLTDRAALADAMDGCDVIYHVAGVSRMCPRDPAELDATNIAGAVTAVQAAADARVARLVPHLRGDGALAATAPARRLDRPVRRPRDTGPVRLHPRQRLDRR